MPRTNLEVVEAIYEDVLAEGRVSDPATFERLQELFDPAERARQLLGVRCAWDDFPLSLALKI